MGRSISVFSLLLTQTRGRFESLRVVKHALKPHLKMQIVLLGWIVVECFVAGNSIRFAGQAAALLLRVQLLGCSLISIQAAPSSGCAFRWKDCRQPSPSLLFAAVHIAPERSAVRDSCGGFQKRSPKHAMSEVFLFSTVCKGRKHGIMYCSERVWDSITLLRCFALKILHGWSWSASLIHRKS